MADSIYNLTAVSNSSNYLELTQNVNTLTGDWYGFMVLLSFWIILIVGYRDESMAVRVTAASYVTTLVSFLFRLIDLTGDLVVLGFVLITAASTIIMYGQN